MYNGNLINDLMAAVERSEQRVQEKRAQEEIQLRYRFEWLGSRTNRERSFAGAA
jgi:hypothetical protein